MDLHLIPPSFIEDNNEENNMMVQEGSAKSLKLRQRGILTIRISSFEAESHELPEKVRQAKAKYPNRKVYVSSLSKSKGSKPLSRYRYQTEVGAYIVALVNPLQVI
jgi:hypothetical protein